MLSGRATTRIVLALAGLALGVIAVTGPRVFDGLSSQVVSGLLFGTFFGLIALAGGWLALGFAGATARFWQSMALCALTVIALVVNAALFNPSSEYPAFAGVMGLVAVGQCLLIAAPLLLLFTI